MQSDPLIWQLLLQLALVFCNAIFACAEIAVISINDARLALLAADGDIRAKRLVKLTDEPARFLATIQVAITLSGFLGSAFAADNFSERLVNLLVNTGVTIPTATLDTVCVIVITLILSYLTLVLGELVPKRLAMKHTESLALGMSGFILGISRLFKPIVSLLTLSTNGMLRLFGVDPHEEDESATEEEIRMMIDVGSQKGTIDVDEKQMLQNVFEFDDCTAGELATHRTMVNMLRLEDDDAAWQELIHQTRHSFYPICSGNTDNVTGVLDAKDYFRLTDRSRESVLMHAVSEPYFVPESVPADALFADMKKRRNFFAVVLDEYGGVEGIVTMNDLIEVIVGELLEEDEAADFILEQHEDGLWRVSGSVPLDELEEAFAMHLPCDEFETFGGLVFSTQTVVPRDGTQFACEVEGLEVQVTRIRRHRIEEAFVRVPEKSDDSDTDDED